MFELNKKQVGAVIKILSNHPDRPMMEYLRIDTMDNQPNLVTVATNGFVMAVIQTGLSAEVHRNLIGKGVHLDEFKRWYATASNKDLFGEEQVMEATTDINYPFDWHRAIPATPAPVNQVFVDPDLMKLLEGAAGTPLCYTAYGDNTALIAKEAGNMYLIMPKLQTRG